MIADTNRYIGNFAEYGEDFADYPFSIRYELANSDVIGTSIDSEAGVIKIAPGQVFPLQMTLFDLEGNIYSNEHNSIATMKFKEN